MILKHMREHIEMIQNNQMLKQKKTTGVAG